MIRHLLFDLDNTLYSASNAINEAISNRMIAYVADFLGISAEEARSLRAKCLPRFATTLEWIQRDYGFTAVDDYFAAVHPDSEINEIAPDDALRPFLLGLGLPMTVLTNAPKIHASRLLSFFHIDDLFTGVHDVQSLGLRGKPHPDSYLTALRRSGYSIGETLFLDDTPRYVQGFRNIGGKAVLVSDDEADIAVLRGIPHIPRVYDLPTLLAAR